MRHHRTDSKNTGDSSIGVDEEGAGQPRELIRLLDLPDQVTRPEHPRLVLRKSDIKDEAELRFVQTLGFVKLGASGAVGYLHGRVAWIPVQLKACV